MKHNIKPASAGKIHLQGSLLVYFHGRERKMHALAAGESAERFYRGGKGPATKDEN